jgi:hypothetical protein
MALTGQAPFNKRQFNSLLLLNVRDPTIPQIIGAGAIAESQDTAAGAGSYPTVNVASALGRRDIGPKSAFSKFRSGVSGISPPLTVNGTGTINEGTDTTFGVGSGPGYKLSALDPKRIGPQSPFSKFRDSRLRASIKQPPALNSGAINEGADTVAGTGLFLVPSVSFLSAANPGPGFDAPFNLNQFKPLIQGAVSKPNLAGIGSINESADIVAGTGARAFLGSGAITEGSDIVNGAGLIIGQGAGAIVESSDLVIGAGIQAAIATGAILEGSDSVAGTGSSGVNGLGAIAEAQDTAAGTGAQTDSGVGAIVENNDIVAGTGNALASLDGNGSIAEQADVAAGLGSALASGFGAIAELQDVLAGFGFVGNLLFGGPRYIIKRVRGRTFTISATMAKRFNVKDPTEAIKLTFDFTPDLQLLSGVTLNSTIAPIVTITNFWGGDTVPTLSQNGSAGFDVTLTKVIVPVLGGLDENDYQIRIVVQTTDPLTILELTGILPVRAN